MTTTSPSLVFGPQTQTKPYMCHGDDDPIHHAVALLTRWTSHLSVEASWRDVKYGSVNALGRSILEEVKVLSFSWESISVLKDSVQQHRYSYQQAKRPFSGATEITTISTAVAINSSWGKREQSDRFSSEWHPSYVHRRHRIMHDSNLLFILTFIKTSTQVAWQTLCVAQVYGAHRGWTASQLGVGVG
jgi:hypothetical protein